MAARRPLEQIEGDRRAHIALHRDLRAEKARSNMGLAQELHRGTGGDGRGLQPLGQNHDAFGLEVSIGHDHPGLHEGYLLLSLYLSTVYVTAIAIITLHPDMLLVQQMPRRQAVNRVAAEL
ncbi:hypothetical protein NITHO_1790005 [Nitrolancea hollandica Lb]|uniref:Uncharacterized protein n=1 Tax=Nitrolancea hollandica Lb TaxID=1129897 RepID=I4EEE0_9BACT|nr:hypothetical protein NITHO_1790005 [Nitrolancea hollandica Lb]